MTRLKDVKIPHLTFMENGIEVNLGELYAQDGKIFFKNAANVIYDLTGSASVITQQMINDLNVDANTLDGLHSTAFALTGDLAAKAATVDLTALTTRVTTAEGTITSLGTSKLNSATYSSYIATNDSNISSLTTGMTSAQTSASTVGNNLSTHTANTSNPHSVTATQVGKDTAQWNANKVQGVPVVIDQAGALTYDGAGAITCIPGGGSGEVNTASNVGAGTAIAITTNTGATIPHKTLIAGENIAISSTSTEVTIARTGTQSADTLTDGTTNKAFLATERTKLTGIATGATANDTDANLKARANHTGTQSGETVIDAPIVVTASTLTLDATHRNKTIICNNSANLVITIPQTVFDSYPGCSITILRKSATYNVTITAAAGVTLNGTVAASKSISTQYKWASLYYEGSQVWNIAGDVA